MQCSINDTGIEHQHVPRIAKSGNNMSFYKQIERQLAQDFSPREATTLVDYNDVVFYGRRLQALEMGRLFGLAGRALAKGMKRLFQGNRQNRITALNDHIRQDIGLSPIGGSTGRGYI